MAKKPLPNDIHINLLPRQLEFVASDADNVLYSGAMGAGKTRALCVKLLARACRPGATEGLCRKRLVDLRATTLRTLLEEDGGQPPILPPGSYVHHKTDRIIHIRDGGKIVYFGLDENDPAAGRSNIGSLNLSGCGIDEEFELSEGDYDTLGGRVRVPVVGIPLQLYGSTNPSGPTHFLARRFGLAPGAKAWEGYHAIRASMTDNTYLPEAYRQRQRRLSGVWRLRFVDGVWAAADGVVYDEFSPALHIVKRFPIPQDWRLIRAIDFGYSAPFVCQWYAIAPDGSMYLYREMYGTKRTVKDWAGLIKGIQSHHENHKIEATVADHDAEDRATLAQEGIGTVPARKEITVGIQELQLRLRGDGQGHPGIYFFEDALVAADETLREVKKPLCTLDEFGMYVWAKDRAGKPMKEMPVDDNNHGLDATRYACRYTQSDSTQYTAPARIPGSGGMAQALDSVMRPVSFGGGNKVDAAFSDGTNPGGFVVCADGTQIRVGG